MAAYLIARFVIDRYGKPEPVITKVYLLATAYNSKPTALTSAYHSTQGLIACCMIPTWMCYLNDYTKRKIDCN